MSQNVLKQMKIKRALKKTESKLRSYNGHTIKLLGSIMLPSYFSNSIYEIELQVIEKCNNNFGIRDLPEDPTNSENVQC